MSIGDLEKQIEKTGFKYPDSFIKVVNLKLLNFDLWYIMDENTVTEKIKEISEKYPDRLLIPFAQRGKDGVIACFESGNGEKVKTINISGSQDYKGKGEYSDFWAWLEDAIREMISLNKE